MVTGFEQSFEFLTGIEKNLAKTEKQIDNIVKAIMGGFDAEELQETYAALKAQKEDLKRNYD